MSEREIVTIDLGPGDDPNLPDLRLLELDDEHFAELTEIRTAAREAGYDGKLVLVPRELFMGLQHAGYKYGLIPRGPGLEIWR